MAIGVGGERQAGPAGDLAEDLHVTAGGFFLLEPAGEHLAGGIVDGGVQDEARPAGLQPGMMAAIALHEHPGLGQAIAPEVVARRAAAPRAAQPGFPEDAVDRGVGQRETFPLGSELAEMLVVEACIGCLGEPDDPCADGVRDAPG